LSNPTAQQINNYQENILAIFRAKMHPFVTFPPVRIQDVTPPQQENTEMNTEFAHERRALYDAVRRSVREQDEKARDHFHMKSYRPKTRREAFDMLAAGQYEKFSDKEMDAELMEWEDPLDGIEFRKHQAQSEKYYEFTDKLNKAHDAINLDIAVLPPTEALSKVRAFESRTLH
jgi:hypothetical protein